MKVALFFKIDNDDDLFDDVSKIEVVTKQQFNRFIDYLVLYHDDTIYFEYPYDMVKILYIRGSL